MNPVDKKLRGPPITLPPPAPTTVNTTADVPPVVAVGGAGQHGAVVSSDALHLIDARGPTAIAHGMTGPSSWLATRLPPNDAQRRALRTAAKVLAARPLDVEQVLQLARTAIGDGSGPLFAQAFKPHASALLERMLGASRAMPDVLSALQLCRDSLPAEALRALTAAVVPFVRAEIDALQLLSQEIMALPRGVDGRATQRAVDLVDSALLPRVRVLRDLESALQSAGGVDLHALLSAPQNESPERLSAGVNKALSAIAAQRKADTREITVHVASRQDAEGVLSSWLGKEPLVDTSDMSPTLVKHLLGRARTFHWDDTYGADGIITGHYAGSDHGLLPHLQIHTADGQEVRVFFPKKDARGAAP